MQKNNLVFAFIILLLTTNITEAKPERYLDKCWAVQAPKEQQCFNAKYKASSHSFYHSYQPWMHYGGNSRGVVSMNTWFYAKVDTVGTKRPAYSMTEYDGKYLLFRGWGDSTLTDVTQKDLEDELFETLRYSPLMMLGYFKKHEKEAKHPNSEAMAEYELTVYKRTVRLYINKANGTIQKITTKEADELYGDVLTSYNYSSFAYAGKNYLPMNIIVDKINGKLSDTITIADAVLADSTEPLLVQPAGYIVKPNPAVAAKGAPVERYNDRIHFVTLTRGKESSHSMIVEFDNFMLVAEAPLNSENGEAIIREAKKIAPNKPVKYFTFSHWHNWYSGGVRPFVHNGATILLEPVDKEYINFLASAPRTMVPDALQRQPKPLKTQEFTDSMTISDGSYEMKIYKLGKFCGHARDFQVYYFPKEKMLFEGELIRIAKEGALRKAGEGQKGLYDAIKAYNLDVQTIRQSWPIGLYGMKNEISFDELEKTVNMP